MNDAGCFPPHKSGRNITGQGSWTGLLKYNRQSIRKPTGALRLSSGLPPIHSFDRRRRLRRALLTLAWFTNGLISAEGAADLAEATRALYKGDAPRAQSMAEEYRKAHPASAAARLLIARAEISQGDFDAAYRELQEALHREPHNVDAL